MTTAAEAAQAKDWQGADLAAGLEQLSYNQEVEFKLYRRLVLPLDGFVFWVLPSLLTPSALMNRIMLNRTMPNQFPSPATDADVQVCKGSLHRMTEVRQEQDEVYAANRIVWTSEAPLDVFNDIAPDEMWIGEIDGLKFGFSHLSSFYKQAEIWHYQGFAVYPDMEPQIIDDPLKFDSRAPVVSNSLPAWLAINNYFPPYGFGNPGLALYPAFLIPLNEPPPFGSVFIPPDRTEALASTPTIGRRGSHFQLCADDCKITLWGTRNFSAMDFVDCVNQYSRDVGLIGMMNTPVVHDEQRTQNELQTIAQKKTILYRVSYLQTRMRDVARQLIEKAVINFYPHNW